MGKKEKQKMNGKRNGKQTKTEKLIKGETLKESVYVKISFKGEKEDEKS